MRARMKSYGLVVLAAMAACSTTKSSSDSMATRTANGPVDALHEGRRLTSMFYDGQLPQVWMTMTDGLKRAFGSQERLSTLRQQVETNFGVEVAVLDERMRDIWRPNGPAVPLQRYSRKARFSNVVEAIDIEWVFEPNGQVSAFEMRRTTERVP